MPQVVVELHGEYDIASAPKMRSELLAALDTVREPGSALLVDFADVSFMDVTALGVLAATATRLEAGGHQLVVVNASHVQQRLFRLSGLGRLLGDPDPDVA